MALSGENLQGANFIQIQQMLFPTWAEALLFLSGAKWTDSTDV